MDRVFRDIARLAAIVVVLSVAAGTPADVEAQDLGPKHPIGLSSNVLVMSESSFQRAGRLRISPHRCSRVKAAFIGAAVGFGAGAVYGAVAGPSRFGVLGTRQKTDALLFGTMGAGAGALLGVALCS